MLRTDGVADIDFVLLVTVAGVDDVYDRVRNEYQVLTPIDLRLTPRLTT
jgi:hypothetical protein